MTRLNAQEITGYPKCEWGAAEIRIACIAYEQRKQFKPGHHLAIFAVVDAISRKFRLTCPGISMVEWINQLIAAYMPLPSLVEDLLRWSFSSHWVRR